MASHESKQTNQQKPTSTLNPAHSLATRKQASNAEYLVVIRSISPRKRKKKASHDVKTSSNMTQTNHLFAQFLYRTPSTHKHTHI